MHLPRLRLDFKYDYMGRRIEKRVTNIDSSTETLARRFIYDGWNLVAEINANAPATILRTYAWGLDLTGDLVASGGVGALLRMTNYTTGSPGTSYYPTYDGNGNVVSLVKASDGSLAAVYEYDPYGNYLRNQVLDPNVADAPFRFSTKYTDSETGLTYYGHRYYSPGMGRFVNRDPIGEQGGVNLYAFCGNNSVGRWDYLGLNEENWSPDLAWFEARDVPESARNMVSWFRRTMRYDYPGIFNMDSGDFWVHAVYDVTGQWNPLADRVGISTIFDPVFGGTSTLDGRHGWIPNDRSGSVRQTNVTIDPDGTIRDLETGEPVSNEVAEKIRAQENGERLGQTNDPHAWAKQMGSALPMPPDVRTAILKGVQPVINERARRGNTRQEIGTTGFFTEKYGVETIPVKGSRNGGSYNYAGDLDMILKDGGRPLVLIHGHTAPYYTPSSVADQNAARGRLWDDSGPSSIPEGIWVVVVRNGIIEIINPTGHITTVSWPPKN